MFGMDMVFRIPALLIAITVHEYAHGKVADSMGDPTPRRAGRLTLNPISHLDPIGLLMLWLFKFGWAKPVPINPANFRHYRRGMVLVSGAGPAANVITAFAALVFLKLWPTMDPILGQIVQLTFWYNLYLPIFNLVPIPPLDGSKIVAGILPPRWADTFRRLEVYGPILLIVLLYFGVIGQILLPAANFLALGLEAVSNVVVYGVLGG